MDKGGEYRSLIGLPGGTNHPLYPSIVQVAADAGFKLEPGKGSDPDTLKKQLVYVYDTKAERTGITKLLTDISAAGLVLRDVQTRQSSLEDIFVDLVHGEEA